MPASFAEGVALDVRNLSRNDESTFVIGLHIGGNLIVVLLSLIALGAVFAAGAAFGYTILQPVAHAERGLGFQTRFYVCDFFTLTLLLAIPILFLTTARRAYGQDAIVVDIVGGILIGIFAYVWGRGATALSAIGVVDSRKRCCFLGALLPVAILGSAVVVPMLAMLTFSLSRMPGWGILLWLASLLVVPVVALLFRRWTVWIVSDPVTVPMPQPDSTTMS